MMITMMMMMMIISQELLHLQRCSRHTHTHTHLRTPAVTFCSPKERKKIEGKNFTKIYLFIYFLPPERKKERKEARKNVEKEKKNVNPITLPPGSSLALAFLFFPFFLFSISFFQPSPFLSSFFLSFFPFFFLSPFLSFLFDEKK